MGNIQVLYSKVTDTVLQRVSITFAPEWLKGNRGITQDAAGFVAPLSEVPDKVPCCREVDEKRND